MGLKPFLGNFRDFPGCYVALCLGLSILKEGWHSLKTELVFDTEEKLGEKTPKKPNPNLFVCTGKSKAIQCQFISPYN